MKCGASCRCFLCCSFNRTVSYIFLSVRSAGGTFVDWNKTKQWKAELTRSFTLYFRLDCVWNAHNGATIAVLSSLSKQKYNAKSSCPSVFPSLAKKSLRVRRIWKPNFPFAGEKGKYRLPMRLQRFRLLISLFKNTNPLLSLNHTLSWFSVRENLKDRFLLSFSPRISCSLF